MVQTYSFRLQKQTLHFSREYNVPAGLKDSSHLVTHSGIPKRQYQQLRPCGPKGSWQKTKTERPPLHFKRPSKSTSLPTYTIHFEFDSSCFEYLFHSSPRYLRTGFGTSKPYSAKDKRSLCFGDFVIPPCPLGLVFAALVLGSAFF